MTKPWHMASLRHRQTPRRYKPSKPVGEVPPLHAEHDKAMRMRTGIGLLLNRDFATCGDCGFLVCSCEKPLAYEPPVYASGGLTPKQWLGKKAKAVQADMQPVITQERFDEAMSRKPVNYAVVKLAGANMKVGHYVTADLKPLSPAYLDGIDDSLERASGSASSGLTGKDQDTDTLSNQSMGVSTDSGKHVSKSALPEKVMFEGRPLRVGDVLLGWSGKRDRSKIEWTIVALGSDGNGFTARDGQWSPVQFYKADLERDGLLSYGRKHTP